MVSKMTALTLVVSCKFEGPRVTHTSDQLATTQGISPYKTALISDGSHKIGGSQATCTSNKPTMNLEVPMTLSGLVIH